MIRRGITNRRRIAARTALLFVCAFVALRLTAAEPVQFQKQVAPIFERHCVRCHNDGQAKGGLSLETAAGFIKGGDSGAVITPGDAASSLLIDQIAGASPEMPKGAAPLSTADVEVIRHWIDAGAKWPDTFRLRDQSTMNTNWWSLRPLARSDVPQLDRYSGVVRTPIDNFVFAKLAELGLGPSPEADRRTLIRRLYFDLIGLPPSPEEVAAFVRDSDPQRTKNSSIGCLLAAATANAGRGIGWMSSTTATRTATTKTSCDPTPGRIATTSFGHSTTIKPYAAICRRSNWPATCCGPDTKTAS